MSFLQCKITGCTLWVPNENKQVHGDLHLIDDTYIFNACLSDGKAAWVYNDFGIEQNRCVIVEAEYFERRGVIVFNEGHLNEPALEYLGMLPK